MTIIPEDPRFIPDEERQARAKDYLQRLDPEGEEVVVELWNYVQFFGSGENFEDVSCPACKTKLARDWWYQRMEEDGNEDVGYKLASHPTPCCGMRFTLHELIYDYPQGFGRFGLALLNPDFGKLSQEQQQEFERVLGTPIRIIYQRI